MPATTIMQQVRWSKNLYKNRSGKSRNVLLWHSLLGGGLGQRPWLPSLFLNVTLSDIVGVVDLCQLIIRNEKSLILTERLRSSSDKLQTILLILPPLAFVNNQLKHEKSSNNPNPKCQNKKSFYRQKRTTIKSFLCSKEKQPSGWQKIPHFSKCKDRGPAGLLHPLCHYGMAL